MLAQRALDAKIGVQQPAPAELWSAGDFDGIMPHSRDIERAQSVIGTDDSMTDEQMNEGHDEPGFQAGLISAPSDSDTAVLDQVAIEDEFEAEVSLETRVWVAGAHADQAAGVGVNRGGRGGGHAGLGRVGAVS